MDVTITMGQKISKAREAAGERQQDLAAALGVSRELVTYWENDSRSIKADQLAAIAKRYNVSADYLLGLSPDPTTDADMKAVCDYVGLSAAAMSVLHELTHSHSQTPNYQNMIDGFISQAFPRIMLDLNMLCMKLRGTKHFLQTCKDMSPDAEYISLQQYEEGLQVSLFRFAKLCESIPDALGLGVEETTDTIHRRQWELYDSLGVTDNGND